MKVYEAVANAFVKEGTSTVFTAVLALTAMASTLPAGGQDWKPERAVEIVVGSTPGGGLDRTARLVQRVIQERRMIETQLIVLNKPGGAGAVGLAYLAQHPGDGHHVMVSGQALFTNHILGRSTLNYTDFTPLGILMVEAVSLSVRAESPIKHARELIERLRKDPGALSVAVGTGVGSATQTSYAHAMFAAGIDVKKLRQVTFGSGGESMTALLGGHIDASSSPVSSVIGQLRAGRVRVLAVSAPRRLPDELAEVPTWNELGVKSAIAVWRALVGPKGMSPAQIAFWDDVAARVVKDAAWQKELDRSLAEQSHQASAATLKHWQTEYSEMRTLYTALGLAKQ